MKLYLDKVGKYTPQIMMGIGIALSGTATVEGIKSTFKCADDGYDKSYFMDKDVPTVDKLKVMGRYFWLPGVLEIGSICFFFGAEREFSTQAGMALATASYFENRLKEYKEKNVELYGEENDKNIEHAVIKDHISQNPPPEKRRNDAFRIYDPITNQYFEATPKEIDNCEREMNRIFGKESPVNYRYFLKHFKGVCYDLPICYNMGWFLDDSYCDYHYWNESFYARQLFEIYLDPEDTQYGEIYVLRFSIDPMLAVDVDIDVAKDSQDVHGI